MLLGSYATSSLNDIISQVAPAGAMPEFLTLVEEIQVWIKALQDFTRTITRASIEPLH